MSSLETAIVFSVVLTVLSGMVILPASLCADTVSDAREAIADILEEDSDIISPERLNTFFTGISENYRIIYGALAGEVSDEEE